MYKPEMVPFQVSQHVLCVLPSILVSADGTEPTVEPSSFITAKEHPIHLRRYAIMMFARLLSGHLTGQRFLGYPVRENHRQESNGMLLPTVGATVFYHYLYVGCVCRGRAACLAVDDIVVYMRCHHRAH